MNTDTLPALSVTESAQSTAAADSGTEAFEFLRILSKLEGFELKLFRDEPQLVCLCAL